MVGAMVVEFWGHYGGVLGHEFWVEFWVGGVLGTLGGVLGTLY